MIRPKLGIDRDNYGGVPIRAALRYLNLTLYLGKTSQNPSWGKMRKERMFATTLA